jgi:hypothetical protein
MTRDDEYAFYARPENQEPQGNHTDVPSGRSGRFASTLTPLYMPIFLKNWHPIVENVEEYPEEDSVIPADQISFEAGILEGTSSQPRGISAFRYIRTTSGALP